MEFITIVFKIILMALEVFTWLVLISIVSSWLMAFGVINYSNPIVHKIMTFIFRITEPILSPIRAFIPSLGGMDFSPIIVLLAVQGLKNGVIWLFYEIIIN